MVNLANFSDLLTFVQTQGYWIVFLLILLEGQIVTLAAAFAASFGIFNIWIIFVISFVGCTLGDLFWYMLGRFGRESLIDRHFGKVMKGKAMKKVKKLLEKNYFKAIFVIKMVPPLPIPGLIFTGVDELKVKKFLFASLTINFVASAVFAALGYYSGIAIGKLFFRQIEIAAGTIAVFLSLLFLYRKHSIRFYRRVKK